MLTKNEREELRRLAQDTLYQSHAHLFANAARDSEELERLRAGLQHHIDKTRNSYRWALESDATEGAEIHSYHIACIRALLDGRGDD